MYNRGRDKFEKYKFIIHIIVKILNLLPISIRKIFWGFVSHWESLIGVGLRYCILKSINKNCGINIYIGPNVYFKHIERMRIGNNVSIHRGCYIDATGKINIGDNVSIAHGSSILSFEHTWDNKEIPIRDNMILCKEVSIENDVWIGCGVRILAGSKIENRTIVAAGAVVNKLVEEGTLVGGVPAKLLKKIQ